MGIPWWRRTGGWMVMSIWDDETKLEGVCDVKGFVA